MYPATAAAAAGPVYRIMRLDQNRRAGHLVSRIGGLFRGRKRLQLRASEYRSVPPWRMLPGGDPLRRAGDHYDRRVSY